MTNRIVPGRKYTFAEVAKLRDTPDLAERVLEGYVLRQDLDGTVQFVPAAQATGGGGAFGRPPEKPLRQYETTEEDPFDKASLPPITRRSPQERLRSLAGKIAEDVRAGRVLREDQIRTIVGESWKRGMPISGQDVERIAAEFLGMAEVEQDKRIRKKVADYRPS